MPDNERENIFIIITEWKSFHGAIRPHKHSVDPTGSRLVITLPLLRSGLISRLLPLSGRSRHQILRNLSSEPFIHLGRMRAH